jgi:hypothetical protein
MPGDLTRLPETRCRDHLDAAAAEIDGEWRRVAVGALDVEHQTGKGSFERVDRRA